MEKQNGNRQFNCIIKLSHEKSGYHNFNCKNPVPHPEEIWEQCFQLGFWFTFLNTDKILLIYIILHTFSHFFSAAYVLLNRIQGSSLLT